MATFFSRRSSFFEHVFLSLEKHPPQPIVWVSVFSGVIALRFFVISASHGLPSDRFNDLVVYFLQDYFLFGVLLLLLWLWLSSFLSLRVAQLSHTLLWGSWLAFIPPAIDVLWTGGSTYWSIYLLDGLGGLFANYITFFGHLPPAVVYFGTKISVFFGIFFTGLLVFFKTRSLFKVLINTAVVYTIFFVMASFPSWFGLVSFLVSDGILPSSVTFANVVGLVASPTSFFGVSFDNISLALSYKFNIVYFVLIFLLGNILFFFHSRRFFVLLWKNVLRLPQVFFVSGLVLIGLVIGLVIFPPAYSLFDVFGLFALLVLLISAVCAWSSSVLINDLFDQKIDRISNPHRPLVAGVMSEDSCRQWIFVFVTLSLLGSLVVHIVFFFLFLLFHIATTFYSAPPFRLKRTPFLATAVSAFSSLLFVFCGYLLANPDQSLSFFPWRVFLLLFLTYTLSLPIKDFRDISGDRHDGVYTIPVLFGLEWGKVIVGSGVFLSFLSSVFFLNEAKLFFPSLFFGSLAFWTVLSSKEHSSSDKKIFARLFSPTFYTLAWYIFSYVFLFGFLCLFFLLPS
ncbi:MAG: UbiA family prenyltransferase [Candidatus Moranbacteria bacterium]|nr:UbiA family prenyltransferase [Candidatus Moranbacteria bacterium]